MFLTVSKPNNTNNQKGRSCNITGTKQITPITTKKESCMTLSAEKPNTNNIITTKRGDAMYIILLAGFKENFILNHYNSSTNNAKEVLC